MLFEPPKRCNWTWHSISENVLKLKFFNACIDFCACFVNFIKKDLLNSIWNEYENIGAWLTKLQFHLPLSTCEIIQKVGEIMTFCCWFYFPQKQSKWHQRLFGYPDLSENYSFAYISLFFPVLFSKEKTQETGNKFWISLPVN